MTNKIKKEQGNGNKQNKFAKWFLIILIILFLAAITAQAVDAGFLATIGEKTKGAFKPKQLANYVIIAAVLIAIAYLFLKDKMTGTSQYMIWILCFIIAIVLANVLAPGGEEFIWKAIAAQEKFQKYIGVKQLVNYAIVFALLMFLKMAFWKELGGEKNKAVYVVLGIITVFIVVSLVPAGDAYIWEKPTVGRAKTMLMGCRTATDWCEPVASDGAVYNVIVKEGKIENRVAILRTVEDERGRKEYAKGLPVFILSLLVLMIIFGKYKSNLGLGGKSKLEYILPIYFAAIITNSGTSKQTIVMMGGWSLVLIFYLGMKGKVGEGKKGSAMALGFAFAFVQMICNLLDATLIPFLPVPRTEEMMYWIVAYIIGGLVLGWFMKTMVGEEGTLKKYFDKRSEERKKEIEKMVEDKRPIRAFFKSIPGLDWIPGIKQLLKAPEKPDKDFEAAKKKLSEDFTKLLMKIHHEGRAPTDEEREKLNNTLRDIWILRRQQREMESTWYYCDEQPPEITW